MFAPSTYGGMMISGLAIGGRDAVEEEPLRLREQRVPAQLEVEAVLGRNVLDRLRVVVGHQAGQPRLALGERLQVVLAGAGDGVDPRLERLLALVVHELLERRGAGDERAAEDVEVQVEQAGVVGGELLRIRRGQPAQLLLLPDPGGGREGAHEVVEVLGKARPVVLRGAHHVQRGRHVAGVDLAAEQRGEGGEGVRAHRGPPDDSHGTAGRRTFPAPASSDHVPPRPARRRLT
jgi:hypothetical protein